MNAKTGILVFGTLLGALSASAALPVANPAVHFDASDASTLTLDESGFVTNWLPATAGATAATAPVKTSEGFDNAVPFLTEENGRKAVVFGKDQQGNTAYTLMALNPSQNKLKTVFVVSRQHEATASGACPIWGDISTAGCAISRTKSADCVWGDTLVDSSTFWVNGLLGNSFANCGGAGAPHVMAVRTGAFDTKGWAKYLGGGYVQTSSGVQRPAGYFRGSLHEIVAYLDKLSDEQILATQRYLIEKWGFDGLYVWTGAKDQNWNDGANWACGRVPGDDAKTIRLGGATVVAQGALSLPATALIDLGGGSLAVAGLTGGVVTNSAQTVATLTVNAATDAELGAKVSGNVNLVKNGSGVLKVAPGQTYAGTTTLNGGTFKALQPETDVLSKYTNATYKMVFHLDASDASTITTEAGTSNVTKWASLTENGYSFRPLKDAFSAGTYDYAKGDSLLTTDGDGRPCVRFGSQIDDATSLGSVLCPFDDNNAYKSLSIATVFFVNRQHVATLSSGRQCGLFGQAGPSSDRVYRTAGDCAWTGNNLYAVWTSGKKQYDLGADPQVQDEIEFASASGTAGPHVLSVIRSDKNGKAASRTFTAIGAAYMEKEGTTAESRCGQFDLYEAIGFSSVLTEAEIKEITDHLIAKWGVKTREDVVVDRPENTLSPNTSYAVTAPTTLDFGWMDQDFGNLSFATESASYPLLTFARTLSSVCIDGKTLTLTHPADVTVKKSDILCGNAGISGEFAAVTGGKVWYAGEEKDRTVRAGDEQGMMILLK